MAVPPDSEITHIPNENPDPIIDQGFCKEEFKLLPANTLVIRAPTDGSRFFHTIAMKLTEMGDPGRTAQVIREEMTQAIAHNHFPRVGGFTFHDLLEHSYEGKFASVLEYIEFIKNPVEWVGEMEMMLVAMLHGLCV